MVKTYKVNIQVFGDEEDQYANINTERDYLDLYDSADEFIDRVKEVYPWISDEDLEKIQIAVNARM